MRRFTFQQNHISGFIDRRLDFFLISDILQEYHKNWRSCFLLYRSLAIFFSLHFKDMPTRGKSFWEFKKSLTSNVEYVEKKRKNQVFETLRMLDQDRITNNHLRLEYSK